jgi:hypothetical protein
MRQRLVEGQLHALGIDHDEPERLRAVAVQKAGDERMNSDGLARSGSARDEEVRHFCEVREVRRPGDVAPKRQEKRLAGSGKVAGSEHGAEPHRHFARVRDLDADQRFARNRRFDAHRGGGKSELQVVLKRDYFLEPHAFCRLDGVAGN